MSKFWPRGTIVEDYEMRSSHYEILEDDGFMVLAVLRKLDNKSVKLKTNIIIRPKSLFNIVYNSDLQKSDDIELILPTNWYNEYKRIIIFHESSSGKVHDIFFK